MGFWARQLLIWGIVFSEVELNAFPIWILKYDRRYSQELQSEFMQWIEGSVLFFCKCLLESSHSQASQKILITWTPTKRDLHLVNAARQDCSTPLKRGNWTEATCYAPKWVWSFGISFAWNLSFKLAVFSCTLTPWKNQYGSWKSPAKVKTPTKPQSFKMVSGLLRACK